MSTLPPEPYATHAAALLAKYAANTQHAKLCAPLRAMTDKDAASAKYREALLVPADDFLSHPDWHEAVDAMGDNLGHNLATMQALMLAVYNGAAAERIAEVARQLVEKCTAPLIMSWEQDLRSQT